jgi:archaellum component FlaF (FlaF/FlaG flagellin family)
LEGTVDYIAPQIYWEIGHSKADYETLVKWWSDTLKDAPAKLYIGLADYRANGVTDTSSVWYGGNEIIRQLTMNRATAKVGGEIHFRYKMITSTPGLFDKIKQFYATDTSQTVVQATTQVITQATTQAPVITEVTVETTTEATTQATTQATTVAAPVDKNQIRVLVNGEYVSFDQQPVIENSRTLVPMRAIFEALGADVQWDNDTQSVVAESTDGTRITLIIGSDDMLVNNKDIVKLDVPAKILGSRTMVPLRAISEALNCTVDWDNDARLVTIVK